MNKHFLSMDGADAAQWEKLFALADELKGKTFSPRGTLAALLFNMPSTRTLVSFEAAFEQMGIATSHLDYVFTQMVRGEDMPDTAKALAQYACAIVARWNDHDQLEQLADASAVPVVNAGTPLEHPCQALADLYTLRAHGLLQRGKRVIFVGDPASAVAHSLALGAMAFQLDFAFLAPKGYGPGERYRSKIKAPIHHDAAALKNADAVYTHSWIPDSVPQASPERLRDFLPYQLNDDLLAHAPHAKVMHPLPAFRGMEIAPNLLEDPRCLAFEQSQNRLHVQKALLKTLLTL